MGLWWLWWLCAFVKGGGRGVCSNFLLRRVVRGLSGLHGLHARPAPLRDRLRAYVMVEGATKGITEYREEAVSPLQRVAVSGAMARGDFIRMTGLGERTGRKVVARFLSDGLLRSEGHRGGSGHCLSDVRAEHPAAEPLSGGFEHRDGLGGVPRRGSASARPTDSRPGTETRTHAHIQKFAGCRRVSLAGWELFSGTHRTRGNWQISENLWPAENNTTFHSTSSEALKHQRPENTPKWSFTGAAQSLTRRRQRESLPNAISIRHQPKGQPPRSTTRSPRSKRNLSIQRLIASGPCQVAVGSMQISLQLSSCIWLPEPPISESHSRSLHRKSSQNSVTR